jgi:SAM-dependent methyltransferase
MTISISSAVIHPYDDVAAQYDSIWSTPEALAEDKAVMDAIAYQSGSVLDIGCGTGLFLDHYSDCTDYIGVDPSPAMLKQLHQKHPDAITSTHTFEGILEYLTLSQKRFDLILSLFGSPSYIDPVALKEIPNLLAPNGKVFMMFIAPD